MSKVKEALREYENISNALRNRYIDLLHDARSYIVANPDRLLDIIKEKGGKCWLYMKYNRGETELSIVKANRGVSIDLDIEGFEGCKISLDTTASSVYLMVHYSPS